MLSSEETKLEKDNELETRNDIVNKENIQKGLLLELIGIY